MVVVVVVMTMLEDDQARSQQRAGSGCMTSLTSLCSLARLLASSVGRRAWAWAWAVLGARCLGGPWAAVERGACANSQRPEARSQKLLATGDMPEPERAAGRTSGHCPPPRVGGWPWCGAVRCSPQVKHVEHVEHVEGGEHVQHVRQRASREG